VANIFVQIYQELNLEIHWCQTYENSLVCFTEQTENQQEKRIITASVSKDLRGVFKGI
jgi:hypothetical protein